MSLYTFTSSYNCPVVAICVAIDHFKFERETRQCRVELPYEVVLEICRQLISKLRGDCVKICPCNTF